MVKSWATSVKSSMTTYTVPPSGFTATDLPSWLGLSVVTTFLQISAPVATFAPNVKASFGSSPPQTGQSDPVG